MCLFLRVLRTPWGRGRVSGGHRYSESEGGSSTYEIADLRRIGQECDRDAWPTILVRFSLVGGTSSSRGGGGSGRGEGPRSSGGGGTRRGGSTPDWVRPPVRGGVPSGFSSHIVSLLRPVLDARSPCLLCPTALLLLCLTALLLLLCCCFLLSLLPVLCPGPGRGEAVGSPGPSEEQGGGVQAAEAGAWECQGCTGTGCELRIFEGGRGLWAGLGSCLRAAARAPPYVSSSAPTVLHCLCLADGQLVYQGRQGCQGRGQ